MDAATLSNLDIFESQHGFDSSLSNTSKTYKVEEAEEKPITKSNIRSGQLSATPMDKCLL